MVRGSLAFVLGACLAALGPPVAPAHAQEPGVVYLRGHVVGEDARPQPDVELRIISYGTVRVDDSAEFRTAIPENVIQVKLVLMKPRDLTILYPPGGELVVPRAEVSQPVVIGRSSRQYLVDALSERVIQLEKLARQGEEKEDDVRAELLQGFQAILQKLEVSEADLRASLDHRQAQAEVASSLEGVVNTYLLKLKDLRDAFRMLGPDAGRGESFLRGLQRVLGDYNQAYTALDAKKDGVERQLAALWEKNAAEGLRRDWGDVREAVARIHQGIVLPLNPSLVVLQSEFTSSPPGPEEARRAEQEIEAAARRLDEEIPGLEERKTRLFTSFDRL